MDNKGIVIGDRERERGGRESGETCVEEELQWRREERQLWMELRRRKDGSSFDASSSVDE
ncbi:hypothetical protein A2U01_0085872, partial [Trifolium medium]|nr:hypothetical protein [Trifolium medium]